MGRGDIDHTIVALSECEDDQVRFRPLSLTFLQIFPTFPILLGYSLLLQTPKDQEVD